MFSKRVRIINSSRMIAVLNRSNKKTQGVTKNGPEGKSNKNIMQIFATLPQIKENKRVFGFLFSKQNWEILKPITFHTNINISQMTEETIFDKLIRKEIPANIVYEDQEVFAFRDIAPAAPVHILIIPKKKDGLTGISKAQERHQQILGKLLLTASTIAKQEKLQEGYRIVINDGKHGGQEVFHLHVHLLGGGKPFTWPPGTSTL